jgi:uncharacterized protein (TIGR00369 family)
VSNEIPAIRRREFEWQEPIIDRAQIASMSGLEYLRSLISSGRGVPIGALMDFHLVKVDTGLAVFAGTPAEFHYNPIGVVHGGFAATLLDSALGCSVHTTLRAGLAYTTIELKVNYVRALRLSTGTVTCEGKVIYVGGRIATAEARIIDSAGKLYAHGSTTCLIMPITDSA